MVDPRMPVLQAIAAAIPAREPGDLIDVNRLRITRAVLERLVEIGPAMMLSAMQSATHEVIDRRMLAQAARAGLQSLLPEAPK